MSKRVNNRRGNLGRSIKHNPHIAKVVAKNREKKRIAAEVEAASRQMN